jgi:hypothetical protein
MVFIIHVSIGVFHLGVWVEWSAIFINGLAIHDKADVGLRTIVWIVITESVEEKGRKMIHQITNLIGTTKNKMRATATLYMKNFSKQQVHNPNERKDLDITYSLRTCRCIKYHEGNNKKVTAEKQ